jgi:Tfp pilus assembly protein PilX
MSKLKFTGAILGVALLAAAGIVVAQANEHNKDAATATAETAVATTEATAATAETAVATTEAATEATAAPAAFETAKTECLVTPEGAEAVTVESDAFKTCMMGKGYTEDAIKAGLETKTEEVKDAAVEAPATTTEEKAAE